jgi:hypothetical protein
LGGVAWVRGQCCGLLIDFWAAGAGGCGGAGGRSAYAEAPQAPVADGQPADGDGGAVLAGDVHERVRTWGSLAAEVADAGVPGWPLSSPRSRSS